MSHEHQARLQAYNPLTWPAGAVDTPCIPSPQRGVVRTLRGTVALAVTASEQRSCRHENPLLSPAPIPQSAFAGFRFPPEVIVLAVRWYLRFSLSYRDVEELLTERGIEVDHVTIYRWV